MFLSNPEHTPYDVRFTLFGFPVRIHPFFWIIALLLSQNADTPHELILWILAIFVSLMVHELGHAFAFRLYGIYSTVTLYAFGGLTSPMAYSYGRRLRTRDDVLISFAGVGFQLILAFLIAGAYAVKNSAEVPMSFTPEYLLKFLWPLGLGRGEMFHGFGTYPDMFLILVYLISIYWSVLNIIPIYPLDGGHIAQKILTRIMPRFGFFLTLMLSIFCSCVLAVYFLYQEVWWNAILFATLAYSNIQMLSPRERY